METGMLYVRDGVSRMQEKNYEQAEVCFKRAIQYDEDKPEGYRELGHLYFVLERYDEALQLYDEYIEYRENSAFAFFGKSKCLHELGRYEEEAHCLSQLLLITSSYPGYELAFAKNLIATKDFNNAKISLDDALHHDPKNIELRKLRIELYKNHLDDKEHALDDLKFIMNQEFRTPIHFLNFGKLAIELEKFTEAEMALRQAKRLSDNDDEIVELYEKIPDEFKKEC